MALIFMRNKKGVEFSIGWIVATIIILIAVIFSIVLIIEIKSGGSGLISSIKSKFFGAG